MNITVSSRDKFLIHELAERQFLYHCYNGTIQRPGDVYHLFGDGLCNDYLIKFKKETEEDFNERWTFSRYQNYTKRMIKRYVQAISGIHNSENEFDEKFQDWNYRKLPDCVESLGISWQRIKYELLKFGWVALLWDESWKAWEMKTVMDIYLDLSHDVMLDDTVLYWDIQLDSRFENKGLKTKVKKEQDENFQIGDVKYRKNKKGVVLMLDDEPSLQSGIMWDIAWLNWSLYQLQSWSDQYKKDNSFALMIMQTDDQGKIPKEVAVGNSYIQKYMKDCAAPAFISPPWEVIRELREDIIQLKQELSEISGLGTIADKFTEKQSGIALSLFYSDKFNSYNDLISQLEEQEKVWHKAECRIKGQIQEQDNVIVKYNRVEPEKMMLNYNNSNSNSNMPDKNSDQGDEQGDQNDGDISSNQPDGPGSSDHLDVDSNKQTNITNIKTKKE